MAKRDLNRHFLKKKHARSSEDVTLEEKIKEIYTNQKTCEFFEFELKHDWFRRNILVPTSVLSSRQPEIMDFPSFRPPSAGTYSGLRSCQRCTLVCFGHWTPNTWCFRMILQVYVCEKSSCFEWYRKVRFLAEKIQVSSDLLGR